MKVSAPEIAPEDVGVKLTRYVQDAPGASSTGFDEVLRTGHVLPLPIVKPAEIDGLLPPLGVANVSGYNPTFCTVSVCGLSELVCPTTVFAKLIIEDCAAGIS